MSIEPKEIKAIIFDWGGVCCTPAEPFALPALQNRLGMNVDEITAHVAPYYWGYYRGEYTKDTFWTEVLGCFALQQDQDINISTLNGAYLGSYVLYRETFEIINKLKIKNFRIALLSNLSIDMRDHIKMVHHVDQYFSPQIFSCDLGVGMLKPDVGIYELALERLGLSAEECLFIDDSYKNINAASELGMQTILFESPEQFAREIKPLLKV